jgi:hypothetical protein
MEGGYTVSCGITKKVNILHLAHDLLGDWRLEGECFFRGKESAQFNV